MRRRLRNGWIVTIYVHLRWCDVHGNRFWIELWHPDKERVLIGKIENKFRVHRG